MDRQRAHLILALVQLMQCSQAEARYSQVIISLSAGLLLPPMDHENSNGHTNDESNGNDTSKDPNNTTWGTLRHWLLCRQEEK